MNLKLNKLLSSAEDSEVKNNSFSSEIFRGYSRRRFMQTAGLGALALGYSCGNKDKPVIPGFEKAAENADIYKNWVPVSDRKIRMGIVGYGYCKFGAAFGFQNHPNVEIVAVSDLIPERCEALAKDCKCSKTYPSLEELVKDETIEAVFIATDAPSHAKHAIEVLKHGKHVASAVPAVFGSLEDAEMLFETVKSTVLKYMMFETSVFRDDLFAMRQIYNAGSFGQLVYSEGEYYHYMEKALPSYLNWRVGLPPQWYPTHSNAYGIAVDGGSFTEVSCYGMPSIIGHLQPANNAYKNPFGTEIALFRTAAGGMSRMAVSWDTPGDEGERGRVRGQKGSYHDKFEALAASLPDLTKPPLPPGVEAGGHGGSHGYLMNEFVTAILQDRKPLVDIAMALNLTVSGIIAHQSALKNGELLKIPQYRF